MRTTTLILPPSRLYHLPVKVGVTIERDNTAAFAAKVRKQNALRCRIPGMKRRALDCDVA